jgi:hypothetical protein
MFTLQDYGIQDMAAIVVDVISRKRLIKKIYQALYL